MVRINKMTKFRSDAVDISSLDYELTDDTLVIYNVPIAAEIVQRYDDGFAYKPWEEVKNIKVDQVPLTIVNDSPGHPRDNNGRLKHLSQMNTKEKSKVVVGFMTEPSKPRADQANKRKKYADFVVSRTPKAESLVQKVINKIPVDTSIGFDYDENPSSGEFNGQKYDYIQTDIKLDHNHILIDSEGNLGRGRAPNPIAGIGADEDIKKPKMEDKMKDETAKLKSRIDELEAEKVKTEEKLEETEKKLGESEKKEVAAKEEAEKAKEEVAAKDKELTEKKEGDEDLKKEIDEYREERKARVDSAKKGLLERYPDMKTTIEATDDKTIIKQYDELTKDEGKAKDIGADMMGTPKDKKELAESDKAFNNYSKKINKKKEGE